MRGRLCTRCRLGLAPDPRRMVAHVSAGLLVAPVEHHSTLGSGGRMGRGEEGLCRRNEGVNGALNCVLS